MTEREQIEKFIATRGVTQCPPVAVLPTSTQKLTGRRIKIRDVVYERNSAHAKRVCASVPNWKRALGTYNKSQNQKAG